MTDGTGAAAAPGRRSFHDDHAIRRSSEDALDRAAFAQAIAERLLHAKVTNGLVVGVIGGWGSGKSSIVNMMKERLQRIPADSGGPIVVPFNPWRYGNDADLAMSLLLTLADELGGRQNLENLSKAAKNLRLISRVMRLGGALPIVGKVVEAANKGVDAAAAAAETGEELLEKLDALYEEVSNLLRSGERTIFVNIDDVDRLQPDQIRQIFRLVKSVANFPSVIYVLAFDRRIVERALIPDDRAMSREYLEKIITIPIIVPLADQAAIERYVIDELISTFKAEPPRYLDERRLRKDIPIVFRPFVRTLRDARRFLNAFDFAYAGLRNEVDIVDLVALTILEIFEQPVYEAIRDYPDVFVDTFAAVASGRTGSRNMENARIDGYVHLATDRRRHEVRTLLNALFPKVRRLADATNSQYSATIAGTAVRRLSSGEDLDRFFIMRVGAGQLSDDAIASLIEALGRNGPDFANAISGLSDANVTRFLAHLVRARTPVFARPVTVVANLVDVIDRRRYDERSIHEQLVEPEWFVHRIFETALLQPVNEHDLVNLAERLVRAPYGFGAFVRACAHAGRAAKPSPDPNAAERITGPVLKVFDERAEVYLGRERPGDTHFAKTIEAMQDLAMPKLPLVTAKILSDPVWAGEFALSAEERPAFTGALQSLRARYALPQPILHLFDLASLIAAINRAAHLPQYAGQRSELAAFIRGVNRQAKRQAAVTVRMEPETR